jgi:hypothetical protein
VTSGASIDSRQVFIAASRASASRSAAESPRNAPRARPARAAYLIDDVSYTDTKLCLRATKA